MKNPDLRPGAIIISGTAELPEHITAEHVLGENILSQNLIINKIEEGIKEPTKQPEERFFIAIKKYC